MLKPDTQLSKALLLILLVVDFIWLRSSYGKLIGGKFADALGGTLLKFASENPYPFFKEFLQSVAIPNSKLFGVLTMYGELFVAVGLGISVFYLLFTKKNNTIILVILILSLLVGMKLNLVFWLASGWTSPSSDGLNLLMFFIQLIGLIFTINLFRHGSKIGK